jgi:streptogramin lyase
VVLADDLAMPNAFAMGPDGALWFPQVVAGEIWRYDLDSRSLERRFTDLATPTAVKFDAQGRLLTSEGGSGRLTRFDITTGARETVIQVNPGIDNFAIATDGRLFVSHFTDGRVAEVSGGVERILSPSGLVGPFGLDRMPDGSLLSADALAVNQTDPGGEPRVIMSLLADLPAMAVDVAHHGDDPLVLLARGQVLRRRGPGRYDSVAGRLAGATSLTSARGGGAWLVESGAGRVSRIDGEGGMEPVVEGLERPQSVAEAADGTLWVTRAGGVSAVRGGEVIARHDGFETPQGVAVAGSTVVVADPARRALVGLDPASGQRRDLARNLPLGLAVAGARAPHSYSPLLGDGDGVLVGCDGDGSIRRLTLH